MGVNDLATGITDKFEFDGLGLYITLMLKLPIYVVTYNNL